MKRFVVATDGSAGSDEALRHAFDLAAGSDTVVHVVHVAPTSEWAAIAAPGAPVKVPHELTPADNVPLEVAVTLADEAGVPVRTQLLQGNAVDEVVAYADSVDADLVIVGSRGRGTLTSALLGSVSLGILHETRRPVLIVHGAKVPEQSLVHSA